MTDDARARAILMGAISQIAPEVDISAIDPTVSLRDATDLDSMDFLTLVGLLASATEQDIPEDDYPQLETFSDALAYVQSRLR